MTKVAIYHKTSECHKLPSGGRNEEKNHIKYHTFDKMYN